MSNWVNRMNPVAYMRGYNTLSLPVPERFANLKPVGEFLDVRRISKPANFKEAVDRMNCNVARYSANYAAIFAMLCVYALITNPLLLFVILFAGAGAYGISKLEGQPVNVGSWELAPSQLYVGLGIVSIPLGLIASPVSVSKIYIYIYIYINTYAFALEDLFEEYFYIFCVLILDYILDSRSKCSCDWRSCVCLKIYIYI